MLNSTKSVRRQLLGSACVTVLALSAGQGFAQDATATGSVSQVIIQNQDIDPIETEDLTLEGNSTGSVTITEGIVLGSTLSVGGSTGLGNVSSATSFGNEATLSVTTDLNADLGAGTETGTVSADTSDLGTAVSTADVALAVTQNYANTTSTSENTLDMGILADAVTDSTLNVQRNTNEAISVFNRNTTTAETDVNDTSATTGIAVTQASTDATMEATTDATTSIAVGEVGSGDDLTDSTASLTNNLQRSVGVGNLSTTDQTVDGNNATLIASEGGATSTLSGSDAEAVAGYATASSQILDGSTLSATTDGEDAGFGVSVDGASLSSRVFNSNNTASSNLRGNDTDNAITLTANSINTATLEPAVFEDGYVESVEGDFIWNDMMGYWEAVLPGTGTHSFVEGGVLVSEAVFGEAASGTVAAIGSVQTVVDSSLTATTMGAAGDAVLTEFGGVVEDSTIRTNANTIEAAATGNQGNNSITAAVTTLDTSGELNGSANSDFDASTASAAFAIASSQLIGGDSSITASLVDDPAEATSSASVAVIVGEDVLSSTVEANNNRLSAAATGNAILAGSNSISLTGTEINTTTAVANTQNMEGDVSAVIGAPGTPAVEGEDPTNVVIEGTTVRPHDRGVS